MNRFINAFIITTLAGISTSIGYLSIFIKKKNHSKIIASSLAFASGVMICTSICDLIPESLKLFRNNFNIYTTIILSFLGLFLGIVISMIIDHYTPNNDDNDKKLFRVGIISMIAIVLHNIPEGIITFIASSSNIKLGISIAFAIAMHNIPEGITIAIPIYYSTGSKGKAFMYTLISALSEPLGAIISYIFLKNIINDTLLGIMLSLVGGIMLEISFRTLLPNAYKYNKKSIITYFIIGILVMLIQFLL